MGPPPGRCQTDGMPGEWLIEERRAAPAGLHASWPAVERDPGRRRAAVCRPTGTAVVLGSTQSFDMVDVEAARSAGIDVVRRRSGGGAVLVTPDDPVWIDLWVPTGDERWSADVTGAFIWVGAAWGRALRRLGLDTGGTPGSRRRSTVRSGGRAPDRRPASWSRAPVRAPVPGGRPSSASAASAPARSVSVAARWSDCPNAATGGVPGSILRASATGTRRSCSSCSTCHRGSGRPRPTDSPPP